MSPGQCGQTGANQRWGIRNGTDTAMTGKQALKPIQGDPCQNRDQQRLVIHLGSRLGQGIHLLRLDPQKLHGGLPDEL